MTELVRPLSIVFCLFLFFGYFLENFLNFVFFIIGCYGNCKDLNNKTTQCKGGAKIDLREIPYFSSLINQSIHTDRLVKTGHGTVIFSSDKALFLSLAIRKFSPPEECKELVTKLYFHRFDWKYVYQELSGGLFIEPEREGRDRGNGRYVMATV